MQSDSHSELEFPELANEVAGYSVKFELQINHTFSVYLKYCLRHTYIL